MMDPAHLAIFCGVTSHVKTSFALPTCLNPDCLKKKKQTQTDLSAEYSSGLHFSLCRSPLTK